MPHIRTSPRAIIRRGDLYLVVRYRDKIGDWYVFPGGGQQHGEDLRQALTREVEEETGAKPTIGDLRFVRECIAARDGSGGLPPDFHQLELFFACTIPDGPLPGGKTPDPNQLGPEWCTIGQLRAVRFYPQAILSLIQQPGIKYLGAC